MCIKNTKKSFIQLQKQRIKFFFFLVVSNLTYGKNISDNEHQLIFSIRYSVFGIRIVESEQYYSYSVFGLFSKNELFGIRYSLNFQKRIYSVFGPYSLFVATLNQIIVISFSNTCGCGSVNVRKQDQAQIVFVQRRRSSLLFFPQSHISMKQIKICNVY